MKLDISILCVSFLFGSVQAGQFDVIKNFLSPEEIEHFRSIELSEESTYMLERFEAPATLSKDLVDRFQALNEVHDNGPFNSTSDECVIAEDGTCEAEITNKGPILKEDGSKQVKVTMVRSSVREHQDIHAHDLSPVVEKVCFAFLNSNPDAKFIWGNQEVPVEAGSLMAFMGDVTHSVKVHGGEVRFLGPFTQKSFGSIGYGTQKVAPTSAPSAAPVAPEEKCHFFGLFCHAKN